MKLYLEIFYLFISIYMVQSEENLIRSIPSFSIVNLPNKVKISVKKEDKNTHVIGGSAAKEIQFPWQAALAIKKPHGQFLCGGSLINPLWILTAAHCTNTAIEIKVRLGSLEYNNSGVEFISTTFIQHNQYNATYAANDIAVIKLPTPAALGSKIKVIKLMSRVMSCNINGPIMKLQVSGWGKTADNGTNSPVLLWANLSEMKNFDCINAYSYKLITSNSLCAVGYTNQSSCTGDSGGPLVTTLNSNPIQVAIVSFVSGKGCEKGIPSGYLRVTPYLNWLRAVTNIVY